ncbi:MAG: PG0541 family transporter-associated protein [Bacteroidales bacterium]|jgi:nitrogen regulatory protein PII|nr:PG0541 family transporter-associated protein [Bacteroidales bacterium]
MKAVFISYNQALTEKINEILDSLKIRGFTQWTDVKGRGSLNGEPHMGTHTWPALNSAIMTIIEDQKVEPLLTKIEELNKIAEQQGVRAFVWDVEKTV